MTAKEYKKYIEGFDVQEENGKFYLRFRPTVLYKTKEEAMRESEIYKKLNMFVD